MPMALTTPTVPFAQRMSPERLAEKVPWAFLAFFAQSIGLLLLFVGGLVAVTGGVFPPTCVTASNCNAGTGTNVDYAIMVMRVLLVLGLFGLASGAGLHLQFRPAPAAGATPEETRVYLARRRGEFVLLVVTIVLLFILVGWSTYYFV
jgi:hypothetical protein